MKKIIDNYKIKKMDSLKYMKITEKQKIILLTIFAGIIGAIIFILIYGVKTLNVTNDGWLFAADDLTQQYFGWIFYRKSDWALKIGTFNTLSFPNYASTIYTDSIPLFALIFKTLSGILPATFQYFGLYGFLCYILQGIFAFTLLRKYIDNKFYALIGTIFFIISPYLLQRMMWHTALSSHYLILVALCLFAYKDEYKGKPKKKIALWISLLIACVTIHLYFVPMILIIMLITFIAEYLDDKRTYSSSALVILIFFILAILILFILGANTSNDLAYSGVNYYNINLNTFINPQSYSSILKALPTATDRRI